MAASIIPADDGGGIEATKPSAHNMARKAFLV
jgi:hypothetical protein